MHTFTGAPVDNRRLNMQGPAIPEADLEALDAEIDYEQLVAEGEADRAAGRLVSHTDVERLVAEWFPERPAQRRRA